VPWILNPFSETLDWTASLDGLEATNEPTGFPNTTDSSLSFVSGTRTLTITPAVSTFDIWQQGVKYTISSAESIVVPDTSGVHVVYYDADTLSQSANPAHATMDDLIINKVLVAIVYWNATDNAAYILSDERHGVIMDGKTHEWIHDSVGAVYKTGFTVSGYTLDTDSDAGISFEVTNGKFYDEDIEHDIADGTASNQYEQQLNGSDAEIPILYRDDVDGSWKEDAASTLPYKTGGTGRLAYNKDDGDGSFSQVEVTDGKWMAVTLIATNDWQYPVKMIQGQDVYTDKKTAVEEATNETTAFGTFPSPETIVLYRFIMQTKDTFGGTKKAKIVDITDFRGSSITGASAVAQDHGALSGLSDDDHAQYHNDTRGDARYLLLQSTETELTIATGVITVTQMRHRVDTESDAASDDLVTINGGATVSLIILRAENDARTVVVKHNTGNIWLQGKADISLDDLEDGIMLAWDSTNSKWFDIAAGGGAGTTIKSNWGYVDGDGDTSCSETVTFGSAFTNIPDVVVNCLGYKDGTPSDRGDVSVGNNYVCTAQNPSTTSFTLIATDTAGSNINAAGTTELDYMEYATDAAAQAAYVSSDVDFIDTDTKLVIHFNGADGSTDDYTAETGQTVTTVATAQLDTAEKKFGTASLLLDGNSDYCTVPDHADWHYGAGNFTIDFWVRFNNKTGQQCFVTQSDHPAYIICRKETTDKLSIYVTDAAGAGVGIYTTTSVPTIANNTWYHLAFVRSGTSAYIFLDGASLTLTTTTAFAANSVPDIAAVLSIGLLLTTSQYLNGWIDEVRISKGVARWTENFDVPTKEYEPNLESYSEDTIKEQGTYSLKGVAVITDSLNDTLTRTVDPVVDLSGVNTLDFDIRASRTGSHIKIGIHDSGGITTETTPNITSANTWQNVDWDLSGVSDANKDAIDSIIVTITNADAANTFYIDNMFGTIMTRSIAYSWMAKEPGSD